MLDRDSTLFVEANEIEALISFTCLDMDPRERGTMMQMYDTSGDGKLNRSEFCLLCIEQLWDIPIRSIELGVENIQDAATSVKRRNKAYWSMMSAKLDAWSRIIVPVVYMLSLVLVFNIDLTDDYATNPAATMFDGLGPTVLTGRGILFIGLYSLLVVFGIGMYLVRTNYANQKRKAVKAKLLQEGREASSKLGREPRNSFCKAVSRISSSALEEGAMHV